MLHCGTGTTKEAEDAPAKNKKYKMVGQNDRPTYQSFWSRPLSPNQHCSYWECKHEAWSLRQQVPTVVK